MSRRVRPLNASEAEALKAAKKNADDYAAVLFAPTAQLGLGVAPDGTVVVQLQVPLDAILTYPSALVPTEQRAAMLLKGLDLAAAQVELVVKRDALSADAREMLEKPPPKASRLALDWLP